MTINDYSTTANQYALQHYTGTAYLAVKEIPGILKRHNIGKKALDYGCGPGGSTLFLHQIGLDVEGVDISQEMLNEANQLGLPVPFNLITSANLQHAENTFDIVFSSFVLLEISNKPELCRVVNEVYRVLKNGGLFVIVTGSEELYNHNWLSLNVNFKENKNLKSGDIAKVVLKDANMVVYDYYWSNEDYHEIFEASKFSVIEILHPLGDDGDGYPWEDEVCFPPYVVYVLLK